MEVCPLPRTHFKNDRVSRLTGPEQLPALHLNIDSPRFKAACLSLGVVPEECLAKYDASLIVRRPFEEFDAHTKNKRLAQKRYSHYLQRVVGTINEVVAERKRISKNSLGHR